MDDSAGDNVGQYADNADKQMPKGSPVNNDEAHLVATLAFPLQVALTASELTSSRRWWFASSAFPLIAGTLGPVASAFSICALVRPWRQRLAPGADVTEAPFVTDPPW